MSAPSPSVDVAFQSHHKAMMTMDTWLGLIHGIAIGAFLVFVGIGVLAFFYCKKKINEKKLDYRHRDFSRASTLHASNASSGFRHGHDITMMLRRHSDRTSRIPLSSRINSLGSEKSSSIAARFSQSSYTYEELSIATNGFSTSKVLGQGGFGYVYKGILLDGREVAIKQLSAKSCQGEREFYAEVDTISHVHHRHLVSLLGYCISRAHRMVVYEFVPNDTLEFHLHGCGRPTMDWKTRMKIALGSAKGLAYLHEDCQPKIIHRDIKATNILLDFDFEPKVADFGLAKFSLDTDTHISTRVMGTFGYLAPEYAFSGHLTQKSDVYSFGVVLLELITGNQPIDRNHSFPNDSLVERARPLLLQALDNMSFNALADPRLGKHYKPSEMARMIACAAACLRLSANRRPQMSQIVRALEGNIDLDDLNLDSGCQESRIYGSYDFSDYLSISYTQSRLKHQLGRVCRSYGSLDYDSSSYKENLKRYRMLAFKRRQNLGSGETVFTHEMHLSASTSEGRGATQEESLDTLKEDRHNSSNGS